MNILERHIRLFPCSIIVSVVPAVNRGALDLPNTNSHWWSSENDDLTESLLVRPCIGPVAQQLLAPPTIG
jgi:hypothetical protein